MEYFDNVGNKIEVGDEILVLVPKTDASYRKAVVKDFRDAWQRGDYFHCEVLVEYWDGRLYCNKKKWEQKNGDKLTFTKKLTKAWRSNSDIVLFKQNILNY